MTPDYQALLKRYVDTFGLVQRKRNHRNDCILAGHEPELPEPAAGDRADQEGRSIYYIGFEVKNLEAYCKQFEARGIKFDAPVPDVPAIGLKIAYLTDPDGTYIELTEGFSQH